MSSISNEISIESNVAQTQNIPDLQEITPKNISATVTSLGVQKMCEFLKSNCPALLNEYVLHSNSFITGIRPFLDEYFTFKKVHETYLKTKTHVNTRKTELSKVLRRIDDLPNLKSAREIRLDLSLDTSVLCQKCALKLSNLENVVSQGNELASVIKISQVVQKVKKRIQQCATSMRKC